MLTFLTIALLIAPAAAATAVPRVTPAELHDLLDHAQAVAIDVRGQVPYELTHISPSLSVPLGRIAENAASLPHDKLIVAYCTCRKDELSVAAAVALRKAGFERVAALAGGLDAWMAAGLPVEKAADPPGTSLVSPQVPSSQSGGGRLAPPAAIPCDASSVTVYNGRVTHYRRGRKATTLTIDTDYGTTERVTVRNRSGSPAGSYLIDTRPFAAADWKRIEVRRGVLRHAMRANAWVCTDGRAVVDWRPDEQGPTRD